MHRPLNATGRQFRLGGASARQHHEVLRIVHAPPGPRGCHEQGKMCLRRLDADQMMYAPFIVFLPIGYRRIGGPGAGTLGVGMAGYWRLRVFRGKGGNFLKFERGSCELCLIIS